MNVEAALADARARLLHDLETTVATTPAHIDALEDAIADRRRWAEPWPAGAAFLTCLIAQDLQETLDAERERWPTCRVDGRHQLRVEPELGDDPAWVCEDCRVVVAPIGHL